MNQNVFGNRRRKPDRPDCTNTLKKEKDMLLFLEFHGYSGFSIEIDSSQCLFTLFFVTFGGVATTIGELQQASAQMLSDQFHHNITAFGEPGLMSKVDSAFKKAGFLVNEEGG